MPITPGSTIGPYEVTSQLGEGGMGVVYRGRDSRLQRDVALKVLPDGFASDPDRLSRFQREAQVLASLNHPNIAQIYGLEQVGTSSCIVMELVEGETLADRLKKGPLPFDEATDISRQIADALAVAHERGVVHRDLKPANIKLTPDGKVKVLDFGLAKALGPKTSDTSLTAMPTMASGSMVGAVVGTPGYMSPEQARGKEVDARTDIWAFGCVLYEMLTARQAFEGETVTDIMAKIVTSTPDLEQLPKSTPSSIRLLLSSVLNKNASQRLQHIGDTRLFLDGTLAPAQASTSVMSVSQGRSKWVIAALAIALVAVAIPAGLYFRGTTAETPQMRFDLTLPGFPVLSPDGRSFAYTAATSDGKRMLWVRQIGTDVAQQLSSTEDTGGFLWSPDSKKIAFVADSKLKKIDLATGTTQVISSITASAGASWNDEGILLLGRGTDNVIVKISEADGKQVPVTSLDAGRQETIHALPVFLPDGKHFVYVAAGPKLEEAGIFRASLDPGEAPTRIVKVVPNRFNGMAYVRPGRLLYTNEGRIIAHEIDESGIKVGDPVTIAEDTDTAFSVSDTGLMTFHKATAILRKQLTWFTREGKPAGHVGGEDDYRNLELSPKGDRAAVDMIRDNNRDVWVLDDRGVPQRVTFDTGQDWSPTWSPDGSQLMFAGNRAGYKNINKIFQKPSTGAGTDTLVDVGQAPSVPVHWSPDGMHLVFSRQRSNGNGFESWLLPLFGERKPIPFLESTFERIQARISPDSRFIAYSTNESGSFQVVVQTFPDHSSGKWQITAEGGVEPKWRRDGKELYYLAPDGKLMAVPINTAPTFSAGKPAALFQTPLTVLRSPSRDRRYDVAPDGRFLIVAPAGTAEVLPFTVLVNWDSAFKK